MLSLKFNLKCKLFEYFGSRVFWIYILQRIPMIILKEKLNYQLYFIICLTITIILSEIMHNITNKIYNEILFKKYEKNKLIYY